MDKPLRFTDNIVSKKGVADFGGTPHPLTDKIGRVVFDGFPNFQVYFSIQILY